MDLICQVPRLPSPDDKVIVSNLDIVPGGGACNFAVGLSRLGSKVSLFGHVGNDQNGRMGLTSLIEEKIDVSRVIKEETYATGFVIILVDKEGQTVKIGYRDANTKLSPEGITEQLISDVKIVHASSVSAKVALKIAQVCSKKSITSSIDFGGELMTESSEVLQEIIQKYSLIFLNKIAFEKAYGFLPTKENLSTLRLNKSTILNVTLGPEGSYIVSRDGIQKIPSFEVPVVDTTGAGDAYAAGFIHSYQQNHSLSECGKYAAACAALQITLSNARDGMPRKTEVEEFINAKNNTLN